MHRTGQMVAQPFKALAEFEEQLRKLTLEPERDTELNTHNLPFVRPQQLQDWLNSRARDSQILNIDRLFEDAFQKQYGKDVRLPPVDPCDILRRCPRVFCMLLQIGKGHLIEGIMRQRITDRYLCQFHEKDLEDKLWNALEPDHTHHHKELFEWFIERQWTFCPHTFELDADIELPRSIILPIFKRQQINSRDWAKTTIHQLCIPEEYLDEPMKKRLANSSFHLDPVGTCYYLAVKTFTETGEPNDQARRLFEQERDAYKYLRNQAGMVQYLGAYTHRNTKNQAEHNILLEYGDYDLAEYFLFNPPVLADNVCDFWHSLFNVASALSNLHQFPRTRRGEPEMYWGWHADVKPDNILSVKGVLKLADPGFAGFEKFVDGQTAPHTPVTPMTSTYGSPECSSDTRITSHPQAADMWSLGCVFSVAATWLILGPPGIAQYTKLRETAVKRANSGRRSCRTRDNLGNGDYFHNGREVLPEIQLWHAYLRKNLRNSDPIAAEVLQIIDEGLLQSQPQARFSAEQLCIKLDEVKEKHPLCPQDGLPDAIRDAVTSIEDKLKWQPAAPIWGQGITIQSRKALKSKGYLELPRDDVARISDMVKEKLESATARPLLTLAPIRSSGGNNEFELTTSPGDASPVELPQSAVPSQNGSRISVCPRPRYNAGVSKQPSQSVFDAYYAKALDGKQKSESKKILGLSLPGKLRSTQTKDALLLTHYANRDIKFILDNSASILSEWQKVRFVLDQLVKKASYVDSDGMDLEFTNGYKTLKIREKSMHKEIEDAMEEFRPQPHIETDMAAKLGVILYGFLHSFTHRSNSTRGMTLVILTDGCWKGMKNANEVEDLIVRFNTHFRQLPGADLLQRYVSLQFVSFGDDPGALYRLRHLDNDLRIDRDIDDIIDTEHWTGDIYKMLLGSFVPDYDARDDETQADAMEIPLLQRQESDLSSQPAGPQFQLQTKHRRTNSALSQSTNSAVPRQESRELLHPQSAATVPPVVGTFGPLYENSRRRFFQRDAINYYRPPT